MSNFQLAARIAFAPDRGDDACGRAPRHRNDASERARAAIPEPSNGISVFDGPFVETKELLAGYVVVTAASLDEVDRMARDYIAAVGPHEVDVLELA